MTLVEVMAALAITTSIFVVIGSVLFSTFSSGRSLTRQTDGYESLRLAGASMMNDARFAERTSCDWDYLKIYTRWPTDFLVYKFATWDGDPDVGTPDELHLHRWEVINNDQLQRDDIVGWNLVPPDGTGETTGYGCSTSGTSQEATLHLVKPRLPGQASATHLEFTAFLRKR